MPFFFASLKAARESAVSPDWLMTMQSAFLLREFGSELASYGNACELLDDVLCAAAYVISGTACNDVDLFKRLEVLVCDVGSREVDLVGITVRNDY